MAKKAKENKVIFGTTVNDFVEPEKEDVKKPPKNKKQDGKWLAFLANERFIKSVGVVFILSAIFILLAGISFFLTWQSDQSLINNLSFGMLTQINPEISKNIMSIIGAWVSYVIIYKGFGVAALAIVPILFGIGAFLAVSVQPFPIVKTLKYSFFGVIWFSLLLGFIIGNKYPVWAGNFGYFGSLYLITLFGKAGTLLLLLGYAVVFLIAAFNIKLYQPKINTIPSHEITHNDDLYNKAIIPNTLDEPVEEPLPALNPDDFTLKEIVTNENVIATNNTETEIMNNSNDELIMPVIEPVIEDEPELDETIPTIEEQSNEDSSQQLSTDSGLILQIQETPEEENTEEVTPVYGSIDSEYDPTLEYSNYQFPGIELLNDYGENKVKVDNHELSEKTRMIEDTLKNYGIGIKKISATIGPTVTLYEIVPQDGVRIAKIKNLEDDIALSLAALGIRIIAPIPGRGTIGIEVPNLKPAMVSIRSVLSSPKFVNAEMDLPIAFGKTISNEVFVTDLAKMPHLLMAGATGQGKSVGLNVVLASLLYKKHPSQIKFVLVDPKKVELNIYKTIERHFLAKIPGDQDAIITDTKLVIHTLNSLCKEMDDRYDLLKDAQVRNLKEYNAKFISRRLPPNDKYKHRFLPYIVVVIDELADLMMTAGKEVEHPIGRLAQLARAIGIHLILATQRPSVNIITGTIKANFPARVAFRVSQKIDSRTILDANGADQLIGKGDMLFSNGNDLIRLQCAFVDTQEVERITEFIGNQQGKEPYELPEVGTADEDGIERGEGFDSSNRDDLFEEAARIIVVHQQGSTSLLQRRLNLGYNRAGRLIDQLEKAGIVGPFKGSKAREVIVKTEAELEEVLKTL
jgi:S-DNA-T family DNA segregation ATPase FtsK/SpoIIIE